MVYTGAISRGVIAVYMEFRKMDLVVWFCRSVNYHPPYFRRVHPSTEQPYRAGPKAAESGP